MSNIQNLDLWRTIRHPNFLRYFGDWQRLEQKKFLEGKPVSTLTGKEFQKDADSQPSLERIAEFYRTEFDGAAESPLLGRVELAKSGIRHSIQKGIGPTKSAAFAAVPAVIQKGILIDVQKNWNNEGYDTSTLSAPVQIEQIGYIVSVIVKSDRNGSRFKVHRVDVKENLQHVPVKSSATQMGGGLAATAGDVRSILRNIFAVNENDVSKVVDENGEPMLMYHGTTLSDEQAKKADQAYKQWVDGKISYADYQRQAMPFTTFDEERSKWNGAIFFSPDKLNLCGMKLDYTNQTFGKHELHIIPTVFGYQFQNVKGKDIRYVNKKRLQENPVLGQLASAYREMAETNPNILTEDDFVNPLRKVRTSEETNR